MRTNITRTAGREYYTVEYKGIWWAMSQPINPKTGKAWQATRRIMDGCDAYRLINRRTGVDTGVVHGKLPPLREWIRVGEDGMDAAHVGFSSEALALAAIAAEKERSGK